MDIFEALRSRRSIRKYTDQEISESDLREILDCAMLAPSAVNEQPWHFVVVREKELLDAVSKTSPYTHMAKDSAATVIICGDLHENKAEGMWVQDCSAAAENLMLAARGKNIGSVWCGVHPVPEREDHLRKALNLPDHIIPFALICLGYPAQGFTQATRFREDRVHYNQW